MTKRQHLILPSIWIVAVACGGGQPAEDPSSVDDASEAATEGSGGGGEAEMAWADMNRDQRMEFMGLTVLPEMKKLFQEHDPKGFAEFECQTCHGQDMQAVDYKMPNGLFALTKPDPIPDSMEYDAEMTKFMDEVVRPKMGAMLGSDGFSCFNCHDAEE